MARHSYISTTFWDDAWVQELNASEKLVYLYLMTNPLFDMSGVYKITDRRIGFDTGTEIAQIKEILCKFEQNNKAVRFGEWIIIPNSPRHQNWDTNNDIKRGIISNLQELPEDVFAQLYDVGYKFPIEEVNRTVIVSKIRRSIPGSVWKAAKEKSGGKCVICGASENIVVRHIIPVENGGLNKLDNLEAVCPDCYKEKRNSEGGSGIPQGTREFHRGGMEFRRRQWNSTEF